MLRTPPQPTGWKLGPALAAGLTLRFYPAFSICTTLTALRFTGGRFVPWEWTYPDYRSSEYLAFFDAVRRRYRQQLTALLAEPHHV